MLDSPLKAPHISTSSRCCFRHPSDIGPRRGSARRITVELGLFGEWHSERPPHRWQRVAPFDKKSSSPGQAKPDVMKPGWRLSAFQSAKSSKSYKMIVFVL